MLLPTKIKFKSEKTMKEKNVKFILCAEERYACQPI